MVCQFVRRPADQFAVFGEAGRVFRGEGDGHRGLRRPGAGGELSSSVGLLPPGSARRLTPFRARSNGTANGPAGQSFARFKSAQSGCYGRNLHSNLPGASGQSARHYAQGDHSGARHQGVCALRSRLASTEAASRDGNSTILVGNRRFLIKPVQIWTRETSNERPTTVSKLRFSKALNATRTASRLDLHPAGLEPATL